MQRASLVALLSAALYVSVCSGANYEELAAEGATGLAARPAPQTIPQTAPAASAMAAPEPAALPASIVAPASAPAEPMAPHIALLLPGKSPALGRAAEAVQQGFLAAAKEQPSLPVRVYLCSDEVQEVATLYRQALSNGALAVAGPLTRPGVATLAGYTGATVTTLALNSGEPGANRKLYFFGLPAESEARQMAQLAYLANLRDATVIRSESAVDKRLASAFSEEWLRLGGNVTAEVVFNGNPAVLSRLPVAPWPKGMAPKPVLDPASAVRANQKLPDPVAPGNLAFLATDARQARLIRPYLNPSLPVYATSQVFLGNQDRLLNFDLNEVRFVDMPWLLQPQHPAVMVYPRATPALPADLERLYALGIDAYRLLRSLLTGSIASDLPLDGVTGQITLEGQQFQRKATPAFFRHGMGLTPETLALYNAERAAAAAAAKASAVAPAPAP